MLAVSLFAARVLAAPLFEGNDFRSAGLVDELGSHFGAAHKWRADFDLVAVADHQDVREFDGGARFACKALDCEKIVLGDAILLAARFDDSVHG